MSQSQLNNKLLLRLDDEGFSAVWPLLETVELGPKQEIVKRNRPIEYVYFPETCVCSLLAETDSVQAIEVGMFGFEGMSDLVIRPGQVSPLTSVVQVAGRALRMTAEDFARELRRASGLLELTLRYKEVAAIQFAYTALANGSFTIEERLARWILMSTDRSQNEAVPIVHEFIAAMLAVRRSGITTAMHVLEGIGAIKSTRGLIIMSDRAKLLQIAGECYGIPEREYDRFLGAESVSEGAF